MDLFSFLRRKWWSFRRDYKGFPFPFEIGEKGARQSNLRLRYLCVYCEGVSYRVSGLSSRINFQTSIYINLYGLLRKCGNSNFERNIRRIILYLCARYRNFFSRCISLLSITSIYRMLIIN